MSFIVSIFEDKLKVDKRTPWMKDIKAPGLDGTFDVFAPASDMWIQSMTLVVMCSIAQAVFAVVVYLTIVKNRGKQFTYLIGYGVIMPLVAYIPFEMIKFLDLQHRLVRLALCTLPNIVFFRCIEAMHGTSPPVSETSLGHYVAYYSSLQDFSWIDETKSRQRISMAELGVRLYRIICHFLALSLILSYLMNFDFKPFHSPVEIDKFHLTLDLLTPRQLLTNYLYAVMIFFSLSLMWNVSALAANLQGFLTVAPFNNPLLSSKSPSDFWGKKWNLTIHQMLKRGVFQPARVLGCSGIVALFIAFVFSGFLHDYSWAIMFLDRPELCIRECWYPVVGKQTAFFAWCGFTMLLERPIGKLPSVQWMTKNLPTFVISTLVVLTAVPIAHWYVGDWIVGHAMHDFSQGLFLIKYNQS